MANNEQMQTEFACFADVWQFFKRHFDVQAGEAYWGPVVEEADCIVRKYNGSQLCRDLLLAVISELERKDKAGRERA